ncbi:hypothetical protein JTB14_009750 [Gonioctena quinquepunctata]|nr:hypothetical protein JTB14_009750 [Gonioctena quinquepunctata]
MNVLKSALVILAEKTNNFVREQCLDRDFLESLLHLPQETFFNGIDLEQFRKSTYELLESKQEILQSPQEKHLLLIYEALLVIFLNTTQKERQYNLKSLLDYFYNAINKKLIENVDPSILSTENYRKLIQLCLPYVKLNIVQIFFEKYYSEKVKEEEPLKDAIAEFYDCTRCPEFSREECIEIITKKLESKEFSLQQYELQPLDEKPGNLGEYYLLKMHLEHEGEPVSLQFFVKFVLRNTEINFLTNMSLTSFKKEEFFYTVFVSLLKEMGLDSVASFAPKCYSVRKNEFILLEDISIEGYSSLDVATPFDHCHLLEVLKQLAKLHATSFILEEKLSKSLRKTVRIDEFYGEFLEDSFYGKKDVSKIVGFTINYFLKKMPDILIDISADYFFKRVDGKFAKWFEDVQKSQKYRNVVNHGDTWCNNILFRKDQENRTVSSFLVDYQLMRYCPPAFEVLCILYCTTDRKTRTKYFNSLLKSYYSEIKSILEGVDIDIEEILTLESFMECCEDMKTAAIFHSFIYLHFVLIPKEIKEDMEIMKKYPRDLNGFFDDIWYYLPFKTRIRENIEDLRDILENA